MSCLTNNLYPLKGFISVLFIFSSCSLSFTVGAEGSSQQDKNVKIQISQGEHENKADESDAVSKNKTAATKLHINPQTGEFVTPPKGPSVKAPSARANMFNASSQGLTKRASKVPGGGEWVDLEGRFRSPLTLTIKPDGNKTIHHSSQITDLVEKE